MTASESSGSVCLLEAGPSDVGDDNILRLNRWLGLLGSGHDWDYPVEPQEKGNSFLRHARAKARVDPRYFTDPYDIDIMTRGLLLARKITARPALALWAGAELAPGPDVHSNDELAAYIRETHNTVYHPACTVPMGAPDAPDAPLDPRLRVKGVTGLRVADGSAMPHLTAVNPCITTMMIGEKCADMIKRGHP